MTVSTSAAAWSNNAGLDDPAITVTVSGGTAPYSYAWQKVSGHASTFAVEPTPGSATWYCPFMVSPGTYSSQWKCVVTDSASHTAQTSNVAVTMQVVPMDPGCEPGQMCEIDP
jgi:hypothetical protein